MKLPLLYCTILVMCLDAFGVASQKTSSLVTIAYQAKDSSILKPTDVAYAEAMEFAQFLNDRGINVKSVHRSTLESLFQGLEKAAFFRTDKGVIEVIFFPEPRGAEEIRVTEQRKAGRYLYSFEGQPHPKPSGDTINASRPMYFLMQRNWFIVPESEESYDTLKRALKEN